MHLIPFSDKLRLRYLEEVFLCIYSPAPTAPEARRPAATTGGLWLPAFGVAATWRGPTG